MNGLKMTATTAPTAYANAGGFLPPSLPSPAPSTASTRAAARLPHPRSRPLLPGSRKEDYAREYVYRCLLHISRRYVKKHSIPDPYDLVSAYETFDDVCKDLEEVVDVLWFSGTPTLQVPYLLNIALAITEYLPAFPPSPRPTFALLKKLDHCFSSLLRGMDIRTGETLPGFEHGMSKGMSRTDMVRIRSLADETRSLVAVKMSGEADVDTSIFPEDNETWAPTNSTARQNRADDDSDNGVARSAKTESPTSVKVESPTVKQENDSQPPGDVNAAANGNFASSSGQFHWAVEEDSEDEQDDSDNSDYTMHDADQVQPQQMTPPATGPGLNHRHPPHVGRRSDFPEDDDEDQELHMSVAKVYEKTIVQLGNTLGETLVDE